MVRGTKRQVYESDDDDVDDQTTLPTATKPSTAKPVAAAMKKAKPVQQKPASRKVEEDDGDESVTEKEDNNDDFVQPEGHYNGVAGQESQPWDGDITPMGDGGTSPSLIQEQKISAVASTPIKKAVVVAKLPPLKREGTGLAQASKKPVAAPVAPPVGATRPPRTFKPFGFARMTPAQEADFIEQMDEPVTQEEHDATMRLGQLFFEANRKRETYCLNMRLCVREKQDKEETDPKKKSAQPPQQQPQKKGAPAMEYYYVNPKTGEELPCQNGKAYTPPWESRFHSLCFWGNYYEGKYQTTKFAEVKAVITVDVRPNELWKNHCQQWAQQLVSFQKDKVLPFRASQDKVYVANPAARRTPKAMWATLCTPGDDQKKDQVVVRGGEDPESKYPKLPIGPHIVQKLEFGGRAGQSRTFDREDDVRQFNNGWRDMLRYPWFSGLTKADGITPNNESNMPRFYAACREALDRGYNAKGDVIGAYKYFPRIWLGNGDDGIELSAMACYAMEQSCQNRKCNLLLIAEYQTPYNVCMANVNFNATKLYCIGRTLQSGGGGGAGGNMLDFLPSGIVPAVAAAAIEEATDAIDDDDDAEAAPPAPPPSDVEPQDVQPAEELAQVEEEGDGEMSE